MKLCLAICSVLFLTACLARNRGTLPEPPPQEHAGSVTVRGTPVSLLGRAVNVGDPAPDFRVVDASFRPVSLSQFRGKVVLLSAVPSLDTGVCAAQTKRFNDAVAKLPPDVAVLTLSTDLPFAQKRFCEAEKVDRIQVLSDCAWREFGLRYGVLMEGRGLLSRAIFVIGKDGRVAYKELVPEVSTHPNYDAALSAVREAATQ